MGNFYFIEEHAHQFKFIDDWVVIAKDIVSRYGNINFYCDTARPEYITEFRRHRLRAINADKSKLSGVNKLLSCSNKTSYLFFMIIWIGLSKRYLNMFGTLQTESL